MRQTLERLFAGQRLDRREARALLDGVLDGDFAPEQLAALLACYRMRLPNAAELAGMRDSLLERAAPVDLDAPDALDMVGTGGDGKDTFNVTTLSALTVAACGYRVVKHGNGSASSKHGSSDTLRAAGFGFRQTRDDLRRQLDAAGVTFLHAPLFHPQLASVAPVRRALGVGTLFNLLGPLVNPALPQYNFIGVADARTQGLYAEVFADVSEAYAVVHSNDGYDEATLTGPVRCFTSAGRHTLQPRDFGLAPTAPADLRVADDALGQFRRILAGDGTRAQTDTVAANAGLAIRVASEHRRELTDCVGEAREALADGRVADTFAKLCAA